MSRVLKTSSLMACGLFLVGCSVGAKPSAPRAADKPADGANVTTQSESPMVNGLSVTTRPSPPPPPAGQSEWIAVETEVAHNLHTDLQEYTVRLTGKLMLPDGIRVLRLLDHWEMLVLEDQAGQPVHREIQPFAARKHHEPEKLETAVLDLVRGNYRLDRPGNGPLGLSVGARGLTTMPPVIGCLKARADAVVISDLETLRFDWPLAAKVLTLDNGLELSFEQNEPGAAGRDQYLVKIHAPRVAENNWDVVMGVGFESQGRVVSQQNAGAQSMDGGRYELNVSLDKRFEQDSLKLVVTIGKNVHVRQLEIEGRNIKTGF